MDTSLEQFVKSQGDIECPYCHGKFFLDRPLEDALQKEIDELKQVEQYADGLFADCDKFQNERDALQRKLDIAVEALKYYAKLEMYEIGVLHNVAETALKQLEDK